jgi:hypothetical protein
MDPFGNLFVAGHAQQTNSNFHCLIEKSSDAGGTWSTVDDSLAVAGVSSSYYAITSDGAGKLYAAGGASFGSGYQWFVKQTLDAGSTWNLVDTYPHTSFAYGAAADASGNVFVAGSGVPSGSSNAVWLVRKGTSAGSSWQTVDYVPNGPVANGVFCHPTAGVFVAGYTTHSTTSKNGSVTTQSYWTVRRSLDGGATWATVDSAILGEAFGLGADASGNLYVVGASQGPTFGNGTHWLVRKSSDGGNSWTTVDNYNPGAYAVVAKAFTADLHGNLFVAGYVQQTSGAIQWLVRENPGGSGSWQTADSLGTNSAESRATAADAAGNVYVVGNYFEGTSASHWIVRKK